MRIGRNDPCPCGSGKKYKKCCLGRDEKREARKSRRKIEAEAREPKAPMWAPAEEIEMKYWFWCPACKRKSLLHTGPIHVILGKDGSEKLFYANEVRCRHCGSHDAEMDRLERVGIVFRMCLREKGGGRGPITPEDVIPSAEEIGIDGKAMHYAQALPYFEKKLAEAGAGWETWMRYANVLMSRNRYEDGIAAARKAGELNPRAVAPPMSLGRVFFHRWKEYKEKGARAEAKKHIVTALRAISQNGGMATIPGDKKSVEAYLLEMLSEIGFAGTSIIAAPLEDINRPLSKLAKVGRTKEVTVFHMPSCEKISGIVQASIHNELLRNPNITKWEVLSELQALTDDFDRNDVSPLGKALRDYIKLFLLSEKRDRQKEYRETDIIGGLALACTLLEEDERSGVPKGDETGLVS